MSRPYSEKNYEEMSAQIAATGTVDTSKLTPPKVRLKNNNEESRMQKSLMRWWQFAGRGLGVPELCLFAIPNGGKRSAIVGSIMKAEGVRKGCPDLFLACPRNGKAGLFLELKTETGRLSPEQVEYHVLLANQGYAVAVVRSLDEGIKVVTEYLNNSGQTAATNAAK